MRNKLKANADYYLINDLKMAYIKSRIRDKVALYIIPCIRNTILNQFKTINEIFNLLS
jgi:hypothetical protein